MSLANPDSRRALRAVVQAVAGLAFIGLLYWITYLLSGSATGLVTIARGALIILGIAEVMYGAENVTRAIKLTAPGGFGAEFGDDVPPTPVQVVNTPADPVPVDPKP